MDSRMFDSVAYRFLDSSVAKDPKHPAVALDVVAASLPAYPPLRDALLDRVTVALRDYMKRDFRDRDHALEACLAQVCQMARHREPREAFLKWILTSLGTGKQRVYSETNAQDPVPGLLAAIVAQVLEKPETREEEPTFPVASLDELYDIVVERVMAQTAFPCTWLFSTLAPPAAAAVAARIHERMTERYVKVGFPLLRFDNSKRDKKMDAVWPVLWELGSDPRIRTPGQPPGMVAGLVHLVQKYQREITAGTAQADSPSRYTMAYVAVFLGKFSNLLESFLSSLFSAMDSHQMAICLSADMATGFSLFKTNSSEWGTHFAGPFAAYAFEFFQDGLVSCIGEYDPAKVLARAQALAFEREGLMEKEREIAGLASAIGVKPAAFRTAVGNLCSLAQEVAGKLADWSHAHATAAMMSQVVTSNACRPAYVPSDPELVRQGEARGWTTAMMDGLWKLAFEPSAVGAAGRATLVRGPDAVGEVLESCLVALGDEMRNPFTVAAVEQGIDFSVDTEAGPAGAHPVLVQRFMRTVSVSDFGERDWGLIIGPSDKNAFEMACKSPPEKRSRILFSLLLALPMLTRRSRPTASATWNGLRRLLESDDYRTASVALEIFAEIGMVDTRMHETVKVLVVEGLVDRTLRVLDGLAEPDPANISEFITFSRALRKSARSLSGDEFAHCYFINFLLNRLLARLPASLEAVIAVPRSSDLHAAIPVVPADPSQMPPDLAAKSTFLSFHRRRSNDAFPADTALEATVRALSVGDHHKPLPRAGRSLVAAAPLVARGWVVSDGRLTGKKVLVDEINRALAELEGVADGEVKSVL